mmetsp:Transcript_123140/g.394353  ORF Transcript_123140/g.394353 Transcript_123140/m.394353 type:complete len:211 (+) Transcript_123140:950-1582(+)
MPVSMSKTAMLPVSMPTHKQTPVAPPSASSTRCGMEHIVLGTDGLLSGPTGRENCRCNCPVLRSQYIHRPIEPAYSESRPLKRKTVMLNAKLMVLCVSRSRSAPAAPPSPPSGSSAASEARRVCTGPTTTPFFTSKTNTAPSWHPTARRGHRPSAAPSPPAAAAAAAAAASGRVQSSSHKLVAHAVKGTCSLISRMSSNSMLLALCASKI